ncbi:MAG TPA: hypothetical protein VF320_08765 [Acidimicrobiales bacterium]
MSRHPWRHAVFAVAAGAAVLATAGCGTATPSTGTTGPGAAPASPTTSTGQPSPPATATPSTPPATSPPPAIRIGPGAQTTYSVQAQPAPGTCHYSVVGSDPLPDPSCTPGAINPQVTQADISTTICRSGWTATVRPPTSITGPEKVGSARAYGYTGSFTTGEYDHLIPLELGGDPNDAANLWLEPNDNPAATSTHNAKDALENTLNDLVCSGSLTLAAAQQAIATDWVAAARRFGG